MRPPRSVGAVAAALTWFVGGADFAAAEWFADLYGGGNITETSRFSLDGTIDGAAVAGLVSNVKFENSFTVGGRVGYWFESLTFFGAGLDAWYFQPNIAQQSAMGRGTMVDTRGTLFGVPLNVSGAGPVRLPEVDFRVTAVTPDLWLRWPLLVSEEFPHGQLQPYFNVGPTFFIVDLKGFHPSKFDPATSIGVAGGGGVAWLFTEHIGVFGEYRYSNARPSLESGDIVFKTHLSTHHFLGGLTFRF